MNNENNTKGDTFTPSLDELLDSLGFTERITFAASFVVPSLSLFGISVCLLSTLILCQSRFINPVYFYYRLLCIIYIIHLVHGIPFGILISPRYFQSPRFDSYLSTIYLIYYGFMSTFLYHFEDYLQMAILIDRIKIFTPSMLQQSHSLLASPRVTSLFLFSICFFINFPVMFCLKIEPFGTYYYLNDMNQMKFATFYFVHSSDFSSTLFGRILLAVSSLILNFTCTIVAGVALNIFSIYKYKSYLRQRRHDVDALVRISFQNRDGTLIRRQLDQMSLREKILRRTEKNMFYMALNLCSISMVARVLFMFFYVYFFYFNSSYQATPLIALISVSIHTIEPITNIFVFYLFNKMFRDIFNRKVNSFIFCFKFSSHK